MSSDVYFIGLREKYQCNMNDKINKLFDEIKLDNIIEKNDLIAIKTHFGELGNNAYLSPTFLQAAIDRVKKKGAFPFITDANTLYNGYRNNGIKHIYCAIKNGFSFATLEAPVIIADGIDGSTDIAMEVKGGEYCDKAYIGREFFNSSAIIVYTHFKGHEIFGFGGSIKNIGMGMASKRGKLFLHSGVSPFIVEKKCKACKKCIKFCMHHAITYDESKNKVKINDNCVGCGACLMSCEYGALRIKWNTNLEVCQKKTVEYTKAVLDQKKDKMIYINFIINVSPLCDCVPWNDKPIVDDVGIVISKDIVAIDQASYDLVNQQEGNKDSALQSNYEKGECKFRGVNPKLNPLHQIEYAEKLGLGTRKYNLIKLDNDI